MPEKRAVYLEQACEANGPLRQAVELLIESHEKSGNFVDVPAFEAAAEMLMEGKQLKEGQMAAHYRILSLLGQGGMGQFTLVKISSYIAKYRLSFSPPTSHRIANDCDALSRKRALSQL